MKVPYSPILAFKSCGRLALLGRATLCSMKVAANTADIVDVFFCCCCRAGSCPGLDLRQPVPGNTFQLHSFVLCLPEFALSPRSELILLGLFEYARRSEGIFEVGYSW